MSNTAKEIPFPASRAYAHARSSRSSSSSSSETRYEQGTSTPAFITYLGQVYHTYMGVRPTPGMMIRLEEWAIETHQDIVEYAIMEASLAPRPSWAYINAILVRCRGIPYQPIPGTSIKTAVELARSRAEERR